MNTKWLTTTLLLMLTTQLAAATQTNNNSDYRLSWNIGPGTTTTDNTHNFTQTIGEQGIGNYTTILYVVEKGLLYVTNANETYQVTLPTTEEEETQPNQQGARSGSALDVTYEKGTLTISTDINKLSNKGTAIWPTNPLAGLIAAFSTGLLLFVHIHRTVRTDKTKTAAVLAFTYFVAVLLLHKLYTAATYPLLNQVIDKIGFAWPSKQFFGFVIETTLVAMFVFAIQNKISEHYNKKEIQQIREQK